MKDLLAFRKKVYLFFFRRVPAKKQGVYYFFLLLLSTSAVLLTPQIYSLFVDQVLIGREFSLFPQVVLAYLAVYLVSAFSSAAQCRIINWMCNAFEYALRLSALKQEFCLEKTDATIPGLGDRKMKIDNDVSSLTSFFKEQFGTFEMQILLTAGSAFFLLTIHPLLALCGILAVPATLWLDRLVGKKETVLNEENRKNDSQMASWLHSVVKGWRQVRMFGQEKIQERQYIRFQHKYALYNAKWINYWVTRVLIIPKLKNEFLMEFGVYILGGLMIFSGWMTAGELLVFIVYYRHMTDSMTRLSAFQTSLEAQMPVYQRAFSLNERTVSVNSNISEQRSAIQSLKHIEFKNIAFRYSESAPVLFSDLCGKYSIGDCIGIKGPSGCGKSTLLKLLLGLESPCRGQIQFYSSSEIPMNFPNNYRCISGYIQGSSLFNTTIRENLLYAVPDASEEEMREACEKAQILEEILRMPQKFDTLVGERGCLLSGGQCQRVLLARAFLKKAELYYFDEPASALDEKTGERLYWEIGKLKEKGIVFLATHRSTSDPVCNKFIYL